MSDKVYDATTVATINTSGATLAGVVNGDVITLNTSAATAHFASADAGTNVPVFVSGLTISGALAGNYTLVQPGASIPAGVVAYYRFEEGNATQAASGANSIIDSSGHGLDATPVGGPVYSADVPVSTISSTGAADVLSLSFNGNQRIAIADNPLFQLTHSLTLEAYIKVNSLSYGEQQIVFRGDDRPALDPYVFEVAGNTLKLRLENASAEADVSTPFTAYLNQWTYVAATLDDATGRNRCTSTETWWRAPSPRCGRWTCSPGPILG